MSRRTEQPTVPAARRRSPVQIVAALGPAVFFAIVAIVSIPQQLVLSNAAELGDVDALLVGYYQAAFAFVLLCAALGWLLPDRSFRIFSRVLLAAGLFAFASELFSPLAMQSLETGAEVPEEPWTSIGVDLLLAVAIVAVVVKLPARAGRVVWTVNAALIAAQLYTLATFDPGRNEVLAPATTDSDRTGFPGNVYHIVLDGYPGHWFPALVESTGQEEAFRDFLYWAGARSNYVATAMSFSSFTTGRIFAGGEENRLSEFMSSQHRESILWGLGAQGFRTTAYSITEARGNPHADHNHIVDPMNWTLIADLWALRLAPTILRQEFFRGGEGLFSRLGQHVSFIPAGDLRTYHSYLLYRQMLEHEPGREPSGNYVFNHAYPPHGPYQLSRSGSFVGSSSFTEQAYLATNMMVALIDALKAEGRYDEALILFHSDHGNSKKPPGELRDLVESAKTRGVPESLSSRIAETDVRGRSGRFIDERSRALLAVKLPYADQERYERIDDLVQIANIRKLVELVVSTQSIGSPVDPELLRGILRREFVDVFHGYRQADDPDGRRRVFGHTVFDAHYNRYRVRADGTWTIEPELRVVW